MLVLVVSPCLLPSQALDTAVPALFLEYPIQRVAQRVRLQLRWQHLEDLLPYVIILLDLKSLLETCLRLGSHDQELRMN
jgi:hypothetical protein